VHANEPDEREIGTSGDRVVKVIFTAEENDDRRKNRLSTKDEKEHEGKRNLTTDFQ